jgi:hypothetical protein
VQPAADAESAAAAAGPPITLETQHLRLVIAADGHVVSFLDKQTGKDYCPKDSRPAFAQIKREGKYFRPTLCEMADGQIKLTFGEPGVTVLLKPTAKSDYIVLEVASVSDTKVEELSFGMVRVTLSKNVSSMAGVAADDEFAAAVRALNLQANLRLHGGKAPLLEPYCEAKYGLVGAKIALVGCPAARLRPVLQTLLRDEKVLCSPLGGPFALDAEENRGSYVFAAISEKNVDEWIALARKSGMAEIHLMGFEKSLGHYEPRKEMFPGGLDGLKAVVGKIHAAGLKAGMHTLTGGIAPHDPFITPVPSRSLAKDAAFTLAEAIGEKDATVPTVEVPKDLETMWAYMGHGNVIQIEDELIQYTGLSAAGPTGFTGCKRGAFGTKAGPHAKGAAAHHLFVRYGLFQPDENEKLLDDLADAIARVFNTCGFDMIYLDGLEGMSGGWHGEAKMANAIVSRLRGRVLVEASNWVYHNWPFHSRIGAYDYPHWGLKRFVDVHCRDMAGYRAASLLAAQLGWWVILGPDGDHPAELPDEIEYLCAKSLGYDAPMSFENVEAGPKPACARQNEYLEIIGRWERLRLGRCFSDEVRARLRTPKEEFHLTQTAGGAWQILPVDYATHKVTVKPPALPGDHESAWTARNRYGPQAPGLRIEALYAAAPYDSPDAITVAGFEGPVEDPPRRGGFAVTRTATAVQATFDTAPSSFDGAGKNENNACYQATNKTTARPSAWACATRTFTPPLNLAKCGALGVWVRGDAKGELLNFQLTNPPRFWDTFAEHYVDVNFEGWRYFELLFRERDAERHGDYDWPYGGTSALYRAQLIRDHTSGLSLWFGNLPQNDSVRCLLRPIKALTVHKVKLANPAVTIGGARLVFPVTIESGQSIEFGLAPECRLHDERGAILQTVRPEGPTPRMETGENPVTVTCDTPDGRPARLKVTIITYGEPFGAAKKP